MESPLPAQPVPPETSPSRMSSSKASSSKTSLPSTSPKQAVELTPGLECDELIRRLRRANEASGFQHRILAFYLDDLAERREYLVMGYPNIGCFAEAHLDMERRRCNEYVQVGRQLSELTLLDAAFLARRLSWSKILALLSIVQVSTQDEWIERALRMSVRALKKAVSQARQGRRPNGGEGDGLPRPRVKIEAEIEVSAHDRFEAFRAQLMRERKRQVTSQEVLEWLVMQVEPKRVEAVSDERRAACEDKETPEWLRDEVYARDGYACTHCGSAGSLHAHHIVFRKHDGRTIAENLTTCCIRCHGMVHDGLLRIEGSAPDQLTFANRDGEPTSIYTGIGECGVGECPPTRGILPRGLGRDSGAGRRLARRALDRLAQWAAGRRVAPRWMGAGAVAGG